MALAALVQAGARMPDRIVLAALLAIAAALRLPGLAGRGTWDADQANDMANLTAFVSGGAVPLLGPPTSIGDVHHGALYYYLLAPAALPSGGRNPAEVVALIALLGIAAVAATWWVGRIAGGPGAGLVAGLLAATSATAVSSSTFIWNPNPMPLFAAIAVGSAAAAWKTRNPNWWLLAGVGQMAVAQFHVLGILAFPALVLLFIADARRRRGSRRQMALLGLGALAIVAAGYLPLALHEVTSGFSETRSAIAWASAGVAGDGPGLLVRLVFVPLRVIAWPLTGLVTNAPVVAMIAVGTVAVVAIWRARAGDAAERAVASWLAAYVGMGALLLAVLVGSLGTVTPLPNDHYHAFVAPALFALVGLGAAALWRRDRIGRLLAVAGVAALASWNLATQPPAAAPDGGWPAAQAAGNRLAATANGRPLVFVGVPDFKPTTAYTYPFRLAGGVVGDDPTGTSLVAVLCDDLFREAIGAACGGPAEDAAIRRELSVGEAQGRVPVVEDRFSPAAGRTITTYRLAEP